ncbi:MAG TPA: phosphoethanolamine--lipid A transferase [Burkholderiaceae bacterium]|nr:phosphoethanolamine--lipid A transferase [Burkholderiaceae bacterium]
MRALWPARTATAPDSTSRFTFNATVEQVLLVASVFFVLAANRPFFAAALRGQQIASPAAWGLVAALGVMVAGAHFLMMALVANRWTLKPVLALLILVSALASYFMVRYGVYFDATMVRNVLRTDFGEARELVSPALWLHLLLYAALPLALLWRVRLVRHPLLRSALVRAGAMGAAALAVVGSVLSVSQPFASLMRNHHEVRYLITPGAAVWSLGAVLATDSRQVVRPLQPIGRDAAPGPQWARRSKPMLVVLVVGETARAANWGLDGYARQTTPELATLPVINFREVTACGTSTEVSLPCMFAPVGRRDYDEQRIRGSESLLHVLARAGVAVRWRDNQSGCKRVCEGLPNDNVQDLGVPGLCRDGRCLDEGLLAGLDQRLARASGTQLLVLHQLGNHGPSYFRRYPSEFARFKPECRSDDLQRCTREEIVNAYDNALLYTDHVLARLIRQLAAQADRVDTAMLYVSDHGESLGESRLYLHGIPYPIAPAVQTHVPMVFWASPGFAATTGLDLQCLRQRAQASASHDDLFHTLLGLLDVRTSLYEPQWDLAAGCRADSVAAAR